MIHFKSHKAGLSFIEVMVALMIVSLVIVATFKTQIIMLRTTVKTVNQTQVIAAIKNYFVQSLREDFLHKGDKQEKTIDIPPMKLIYEAVPAKDASVFKNITGIIIEKVTAIWTELNREQTTSMTRFVYKAPAKQEQKS